MTTLRPLWRISRRKLGVVSAGLGLVAAAGAAIAYEDTCEALGPRGILFGAARSLDSCAVAAFVMCDYKLLEYRFGHLGFDSHEYAKRRALVHGRCAPLLHDLCARHGGIYVKAGQHVASLANAVPRQYITALSALQDEAPFRSFDEIQAVITKEFNAPIKDLFSEFDQVPVAAASIAQVHRAVTRAEGEECAVKVQYPDVQYNFNVDIRVIGAITKLASYIFPEFQLSWIVPHFQESMRREFDFRLEAENAQKTATLFARRPDVHVPAVRWKLSTPRVLTMEFVRGVKVSDDEAMRAQGLSPLTAGRTLVDIFGAMIFEHGRVHGDPHPGNFLVRFADGDSGRGNKYRRQQLVILDHGLYYELGSQFKNAYADMWLSMLSNDAKQLGRAATSLGLAKYAPLMPLLFMGKTASSLVGDDNDISRETRSAIKRQIAASEIGTAAGLSEFMALLPGDFRAVMRAMALVSATYRRLGGNNIAKFRILAPRAIRGRWPRSSSIGDMVQRVRMWTRIIISLWVARAKRDFCALLHSLSRVLPFTGMGPS